MKRSAKALIAVAAVSMLGLSACGGNVAENAVDAPNLSDINPQARENVEDGGNLRIGVTFFPNQWMNIHSAGNNAVTSEILGWVSPQNFNLDEAAKVTPNKTFVESVEVTDPSVNPQVVTLKLNKDSKWNNGRPITWEDYAATVNACNGENPDFQCASTDGYNQVATVEKGADDKEVKITFKSTYPDWSSILSTVYAKEAVSDPKVFADGQTEGPKTEWHAGPFIIDKIDKTEQRIFLKRNPNWWGDTPKLETVEFRVLEDGLPASAFGNNEVDVAAILVNSDQLAKAKQRPDHVIRTAGSQQWRHFTFNSKHGVLGDKALRQALVRGINREAIAESDLVGLPVEPAKLMLGNHFFMPGQEGYVDNGVDFKYDPDRAAKELDELGWKLEDGKKFRTKDGKELKFEYTMLTGVPTSENEGKLLQSDLEKIGVNVVFKNAPTQDFPSILNKRNFGVIAFTWVGTPYPMANIGQIYGCGSESNFSEICSEKVDALRDKADVELDKAARIDYTNEADAAIWDEVMVLPIYRRMEFTAVPQNLANYGAFGFVTPSYENIGWVKK